jgi:excisionase family DNA binding protein
MKQSGDLLRMGAVARALGVHHDTVQGWCRNGWVTSSKTPGGHYRISREELERLRVRRPRDPSRVVPPKILMDTPEDEVRSAYLIRCGGEGGPIKIGSADNVQKRLERIQTYNPQPVELLVSLPGGFRKEKELHKRFAHLRMHHEWFRSAPDLLAYIERMGGPAAPRLEG